MSNKDNQVFNHEVILKQPNEPEQRLINYPYSNVKEQFESIKRVNEYGQDVWSARELAKVLGYEKWDKFKNVVVKGIRNCDNSGIPSMDHISQVEKMIETGKGAKRNVKDYELTRYGSYITIANADPNKEAVAEGKTYFAVQTRRAELADLTEAERQDVYRVSTREELKGINREVNEVISERGVETGKDFAKYHNSGWQGMYEGRTLKEVKEHKGVPAKDHLYHWAVGAELALHVLRADIAKHKIINDDVTGVGNLADTNYNVSKELANYYQNATGKTIVDLPIANTRLNQATAEVKKLKSKVIIIDEPKTN